MATQIVRAERPPAVQAAGVLHDIRGSLTVIRGQCHAIVRAGRASDRTIDRLRRVDGEVERIVMAVEQVRRALEGGVISGDRELVDLAVLARDVVDRHDGSAGERGIALGLVTDGTPLAILGCGEELRRLLDNLVLNAIAASGHGGLVLLRLSRRGARVRATVTDAGGAIVRQSGWGMGLRIVEDIAARHGGQVAFRRGEGTTTVTVTFDCPSDVGTAS